MKTQTAKHTPGPWIANGRVSAIGAISKKETIMRKILFTPRTKSGERLRFYISPTDHAKIKRGKRWTARVTDLLTGQIYKVRGGACGLPFCLCDAIVKAEE